MYTLSRSDNLLLSIASTHMTSAKIHNRLLSFFFYMHSFPDRQLNQSPVSTRVMVFLRWNDGSIVDPFLFCLDSTSILKRRITWFLWFKFRSLGIRLTITCHSLSRYTCIMRKCTRTTVASPGSPRMEPKRSHAFLLVFLIFNPGIIRCHATRWRNNKNPEISDFNCDWKSKVWSCPVVKCSPFVSY